MQILPETTVGQLVAERPSRSRIFENLGIDYCCGGRRPLAEVCTEKGLNLSEVLKRISAADAQGASTDAESNDLTRMSLTELSDHIERVHHAMLRTELPRMAMLLNKVAEAHGARDPKLVTLHTVFEDFAYHLFSHMQKEERILFPALRMLERGELDPAQQTRLVDPIEVMTREHDEAGEALRIMRSLTGDFIVPPDACNTHRAAIDALERLEADMHQHVHKENNILFPAARRAAGLPAA